MALCEVSVGVIELNVIQPELVAQLRNLSCWPCVLRSICSVCAFMLSHISHVQLFETLWTAARQAPLSMGFSRQEYWSRLPCPSPGNLHDPGIEPAAPALQADSLPPTHWGGSHCSGVSANQGCLLVPRRSVPRFF